MVKACSSQAHTADNLKRASASIFVLLISASCALGDTAILVALPSEQGALSREVRIVGQPVEIAQHKISIGYHKGEKFTTFYVASIVRRGPLATGHQ